jgi:hypothetical protein
MLSCHHGPRSPVATARRAAPRCAQADGNLVLYAPGSIPLRASNTAGHGGAQLVMQAGGDLVVAAPGGRRCGPVTPSATADPC